MMFILSAGINCILCDETFLMTGNKIINDCCAMFLVYVKNKLNFIFNILNIMKFHLFCLISIAQHKV